MILTPEQIERLVESTMEMKHLWPQQEIRDTLAAYAKIVERVAEEGILEMNNKGEWYVVYRAEVRDAARKLRGKE